MVDINKFVARYNKEEIKSYFHDTFKQADVNFFDTIREAHTLTLQDSLRKPDHYKHRNFNAEVMYGNMVGKFTDKYPTRMRKDKHNRPYLALGTDIRIYFKKLDEKYKPNNIVTNHVLDLWNQNIVESGTQVHVAYIGYNLKNEDWAELSGIYAAYIHAFYPTKVEWVLDMSNSEYFKQVPIIEVPQTKEETLYQIKPTAKPKENNL